MDPAQAPEVGGTEVVTIISLAVVVGFGGLLVKAWRRRGKAKRDEFRGA